MDPDAVKIVQRLTRFHHSAYLVGGCVRDLLLDLRPKDFDVGTSATPRQVKRLFRNCRIIGRRFRLAHIYFQNGKIIEVATFRGRNGDGAPPKAASDLLIREDNQFGTPEEDALRRDFTINSLFYDVNNETVLDHADGLGDLRRRLVRTIGDPEVRFREDPIRILRAIKFAARLGFSIEPDTLEALRRTRREIPKAAAPRILEEINRFCRGGAARQSFEMLREVEVWETLLPEMADAYAERPSAWPLLLHLLDALDDRQRQSHEISTGEILCLLLIPSLQQRLGWDETGRAEQPTGLKVREIVDRVMRPLALRLRISRRDQEQCRLIVMSLFRMVPAKRIRRNTRRSILRRECLADALWILQALAERFGGEFNEARDYWERAAASAEPAVPAAKRPAREGAAASGGGRRRRGGRRRSRAKREPVAAGPRSERPRAVDDDYFFSALPSVPELAGEEPAGARYDGAASSRVPAGGEGRSRPVRRRRRSRRRRKAAPPAGDSAGAKEDDSGS